MWPDLVSNPGSLTYESGALLTALRGPAKQCMYHQDISLLFEHIDITPFRRIISLFILIFIWHHQLI